MKENNNWKLLFRGNNLIDIELKRKILEKKNIRCNLLNKKDSAFHPISFTGETIELYVLKKDFQQAAELIKSTIKQKSFATKHKKRIRHYSFFTWSCRMSYRRNFNRICNVCIWSNINFKLLKTII